MISYRIRITTTVRKWGYVMS